MSDHHRPLGGFEQAVLLALVSLKDEAYGVSIRNELERQLGRSVSFGAVYTTLDRLLAKGLVNAHLGEPTSERGGRAKKFFTIDPRGLEALRHTRHATQALWAITPLPRTQ